jgi:predicted RNase H-like HicB family nuclease
MSADLIARNGDGDIGYNTTAGTGKTSETALADLHAARRSMIEALLAEGYSIPEPDVVPSAGD